MLVPGAVSGCGSAGNEQPANEESTSGENAAEEAAQQDGSPPEEKQPVEEKGSGKEEKASSQGESGGAGSGDDALVVVDREYDLSEGYEPEDLVQLSDYGVSTLEGRDMRMRDEAARSLSDLTGDAEADGVELVVGSAYRSHERQVISYENWTAVHGESGSGFSAPPGHSEHQLGTVADFTNAATGYELGQRFGKTGASEWLRQNAARYGFVMSYPKDSQRQTGYKWEPWHYRYIGPDNAARYKNGNYDSPRQFLLEEGVRPSGSNEPRTQPANSESGGDGSLKDGTPPRGGG